MSAAFSHRVLLTAGAALSLLGVTSELTAQSGHAGEAEITVMGTLQSYRGTTLDVNNQLVAGGRIGFFPTRFLDIEVGGDFTETQTATAERLTVTRFTGTVFGVTRFGVYLGAGYERLYYREADEFVDNGIHLILGDRFPIGARMALRLEATGTYFPSSPRQAGTDRVVNLGVSAGLSIFAFGGAPRDADGDGVGNTSDKCPETPKGATVDSDGCALDSDSDGVYDGLDQCPDTPLGAGVNDVGCSADDDGDGVFNGLDSCPDTPIGAEVDEFGCPRDEDLDRVFDGIDLCPATPIGATVDEFGCSPDEDADGVFDGIDQCPGTPPGVGVDEFGCPADDDMDGVLNALDLCPNTPANTEVDEFGCPPSDTDGDGVYDSVDRCPNTTPGRQVDNVGCPILFVVEEGEERPLVLLGVNFATGSARLTTESYAILNEVAASLLVHSEVRIEVAGHTDITGPRSLNIELSLRRAESVRSYLAQSGVPMDRMVARGHGPDQPIATNSTGDGRRQNRRVELRRIDQQ